MPPRSAILLLQLSVMARSQLNGSQVSLSCLYKGNGDALDRGNYRGLKLTEQAMKILERIVDGLIRQVVSIEDSQFGFVQGRSTTDAIFVVRQLQEKYSAVNKRLYMAFIDLEKAFDRVRMEGFPVVPEKLGVQVNTHVLSVVQE